MTGVDICVFTFCGACKIRYHFGKMANASNVYVERLLVPMTTASTSTTENDRVYLEANRFDARTHTRYIFSNRFPILSNMTCANLA